MIHFCRLTKSAAGGKGSDELEELRREATDMLESTNVHLNQGYAIQYVSNAALLQTINTLDKLGGLDLGIRLKPEEKQSSCCSVVLEKTNYQRKCDVIANKSCESLPAYFDWSDVLGNRLYYNLRQRSLDEQSWSCGSDAVSETSASNNSAYSLDETRQLGNKWGSRTEDKILNTIHPSLQPHSNRTSLKRLKSATTDMLRKVKGSFETQHDTIMSPGFELLNTFEVIEHRTPCVISDIACFPDMRIVVLDHYHTSIQMYSPDFQLEAEETCDYPISCCIVNSDFVAVSLRRPGQIALFRKVVSERAKLQLVRTIKIPCKRYLWQTKYKCGRLFVTCDENEIHVMDINGKEYYRIPSGISTEGGYIRYFDVSDDAQALYLSERRGLRCITVEGEFKWLFDINKLPRHERNPQGHVIEGVWFHKKSLICTQWISSKIYQISLDGKFLRNVVIEGVEHPRSLAIVGDRLFVTQFYPSMKSQNKRQIKEFKMPTVS